MYSKKKTHDIMLQILHMLETNPEGLKRGEIDAKFLYKKANAPLGRRKGSTYPLGTYNDFATKPTISLAIKEGEEKGFIVYDRMAQKRYKTTDNGKKYLKKFEVADVILSSNYWDSYFSWNPSSKEPEAATYNLVQADKTETGHSMALLLFRLRRLQTVSWKSWLSDVIEYAIETELIDAEGLALLTKLQSGEATAEEIGAFTEKLKVVWGTMFKGVKIAATVQYIDPQLMLDRITAELAQQ